MVVFSRWSLSRARFRVGAGLAGAALVVVTACGGGASDPPVAARESMVSAKPTTTAAPSLDPVDFGDTEVSINGLDVVLHEGTFSGSGLSTELDVTLTATNHAPQPRSLSPMATVETGGKSVGTGMIEGSDQIEAGASADATLSIKLFETPTDRAETYLVFGRPTEQQVRVPLEGKAGLVALLPVAQQTPAPFAVGAVTVTPTKLEVTYSNPGMNTKLHNPAPKGQVWVSLQVDAPDATFSIADAGVLTLPDGTTAESKSVERGMGSEDARRHQQVAWLVPDRFAGTCTYAVQALFPQGATGSVSFTLVEAT